VRNFERHMWMAHIVQHATCVPVFVHNGEVSFVTNDHVSVEAWGSAGKRDIIPVVIKKNSRTS
jgi:hypothetical protein